MSDEHEENCDVAIVGGGPAGLAAANEMRELGIGSVVVIEREAELGGMPRHCGHYPFGLREFRRLLRGPDYAARLAERARAAGVSVRTGTTVASLSQGPVLELSTPGGPRRLSAKRVLLATGAREKSRAARMIGGSKPGGVLSTGALQGLVYLKGLRPFRQPVIVGTEMVSFSALLTCRHAGIKPAAMIEAGPCPTARWPAAMLPRMLGVPLLLGSELISIHGDRAVEEVVIHEASGAIRSLRTDGVIISGQFMPEAILIQDSHLEIDPRSGGPAIDQFGRCSDPDFFAAGNLLRPVETAGWSWAEGRAAARAIARSFSGSLPPSRTGISVRPAGELLKYVLPQHVVPGALSDAVTNKFQLRVTGPARGRLHLHVNGAEIWSAALDSQPERRITLPLSILPQGFYGHAEFSIVENTR